MINVALDPRQGQVLLAVVREYIRTAQPVSSSHLVEQYGLSCSSATVRNVMARLEELGFLGQPHTSAGRVPQDPAYRYYVDRLVESGIATPPEAPVIRDEVVGAQAALESLMEQASRLLTQTTRHTSLILAPRLRRSFFRYLQLVPLGPRRLLFVLLTKTGSVVEKLLELSLPVPPDLLEGMTEALNRRLRGVPLVEISQEMLGEMRSDVDPQILQGLTLAARDDSLESGARLVLGGTSRLLDQPEFRDVERLRTILKVLEQEEILAEVLTKTLETPGFRIWIGQENELVEMSGCSLLAVSYSLRGEPVGTLGLLGPTRMPYDRMLAILNCVAQSVSQRLERLGTLV